MPFSTDLHWECTSTNLWSVCTGGLAESNVTCPPDLVQLCSSGVGWGEVGVRWGGLVVGLGWGGVGWDGLVVGVGWVSSGGGVGDLCKGRLHSCIHKCHVTIATMYTHFGLSHCRYSPFWKTALGWRRASPCLM